MVEFLNAASLVHTYKPTTFIPATIILDTLIRQHLHNLSKKKITFNSIIQSNKKKRGYLASMFSDPILVNDQSDTCQIICKVLYGQ